MMSTPEPNPVVEDLERALTDAEAASAAQEVLVAPEAALDPLAGVQQPTNNEVANALQAVKDAGG